MDVSGKEIVISGTEHKVKILNKDVSKIVVSGVNNVVLYPIGANPQIINSGVDTLIRTYSDGEVSTIPITTSESKPISNTIQNINGNYKVQDVSGNIININEIVGKVHNFY